MLRQVEPVSPGNPSTTAVRTDGAPGMNGQTAPGTNPTPPAGNGAAPRPKRPSTPAQQAASRANGARSRGPVSAEGKRRSSANALKDGFFARVFQPWRGDAQCHILHEHYRRDLVDRYGLETAQELALAHSIACDQMQVHYLQKARHALVASTMDHDYNEFVQHPERMVFADFLASARENFPAPPSAPRPDRMYHLRNQIQWTVDELKEEGRRAAARLSRKTRKPRDEQALAEDRRQKAVGEALKKLERLSDDWTEFLDNPERVPDDCQDAWKEALEYTVENLTESSVALRWQLGWERFEREGAKKFLRVADVATLQTSSPPPTPNAYLVLPHLERSGHIERQLTAASNRIEKNLRLLLELCEQRRQGEAELAAAADEPEAGAAADPDAAPDAATSTPPDATHDAPLPPEAPIPRVRDIQRELPLWSTDGREIPYFFEPEI